MSPYDVDLYVNLTASEWAGIDTALDATIAMNITSLVVSSVCLALLVLGGWERLARGGAAWWAQADAQFIGMLVLMNSLNLLFQALDLAADYAPPNASAEYCFGVSAVPFIIYGALYTVLYLFLLKRASLTQTLLTWALDRSRCQRAAWYSATFGSVTIMPIYVAVVMSHIESLPSYTGCYSVLTFKYVGPVFASLATIVLNATLLALFVAPLYQDDFKEKQPRVRRAARYNIALSALSVGIQTVYLLMLAASQIPAAVWNVQIQRFSPTWNMVWASYFFQALDPTLSIICCQLMTKVWWPQALRRLQASLTTRLGKSTSGPTTSGRPGAAVAAAAATTASSPSSRAAVLGSPVHTRVS